MRNRLFSVSFPDAYSKYRAYPAEELVFDTQSLETLPIFWVFFM